MSILLACLISLAYASVGTYVAMTTFDAHYYVGARRGIALRAAIYTLLWPPIVLADYIFFK